jgi:hypothetical protein
MILITQTLRLKKKYQKKKNKKNKKERLSYEGANKNNEKDI